MIIEYHRPETISQALELLARPQPLTLPLGGGTTLARQANEMDEPVALVDLQRLPLREIRREGQLLQVGGGVTLQQLVEHPDVPAALRASLTIEAGLNLRHMATAAGTIITCDGRSPFVTALLALDPRLLWVEAGQGEETQVSLGEFLMLRGARPASSGRLLTAIQFPLNAELHFESIARTPLDRPVVCAALAAWPSGRARLALGGYGKAPILAMDGPEPGGAGMAARSAYRAAEDAWATAEYRSAAAAVLAERLVASLQRGAA